MTNGLVWGFRKQIIGFGDGCLCSKGVMGEMGMSFQRGGQRLTTDRRMTLEHEKGHRCRPRRRSQLTASQSPSVKSPWACRACACVGEARLHCEKHVWQQERQVDRHCDEYFVRPTQFEASPQAALIRIAGVSFLLPTMFREYGCTSGATKYNPTLSN